MKQNSGERGTGKSRFEQEKWLDIYAAATARDSGQCAQKVKHDSTLEQAFLHCALSGLGTQQHQEVTQSFSTSFSR